MAGNWWNTLATYAVAWQLGVAGHSERGETTVLANGQCSDSTWPPGTLCGQGFGWPSTRNVPRLPGTPFALLAAIINENEHVEVTSAMTRGEVSLELLDESGAKLDTRDDDELSEEAQAILRRFDARPGSAKMTAREAATPP